MDKKKKKAQKRKDLNPNLKCVMEYVWLCNIPSDFCNPNICLDLMQVTKLNGKKKDK